MQTTTITRPIASLRVSERYAGPPATANGGWLAGHLAGFLDAPAVEVTLRRPTPLGRPLDVAGDDDAVVLCEDGTLLAEARPVTTVPSAPPFLNVAAAEEARFRFRGHWDHPFPGCFVCGTDRPAGDGLGIFPGLAVGRSSLVASTWTPRGPGPVPVEHVWGALDCPTAWAHAELSPVAPALLGRITGHVRRLPVAGEPHVVVGQATGREGRKTFGRSGLFDRRGTLLASAEAVWIDVAPVDLTRG